MVNKLSDLKIGETYFMCFMPERKYAKEAVLISIINEQIEFNSEDTELYVSVKRSNRITSFHLVYACEIGIGSTKKESVMNYGRFKKENVEWESKGFRTN